MTNLKRIPFSQWDARFKPLLERGCKELVEVPCTDRKSALHLRQLLNTFRSKLRTDKRPGWEALYGTIISTKKGAANILTLRPRNADYDAALSALNLVVPDPNLTEDPLDMFPATEAKEIGND